MADLINTSWPADNEPVSKSILRDTFKQINDALEQTGAILSEDGIVTRVTGELNFSGGSTGYVWTVQADGSVAFAPAAGAVSSVNGQTGAVVLDVGNALEIRGVAIDATVQTPDDGDILVYRLASGGWVREAKPAGGSNPAVADITDVTITAVADNEVLAYDNGTGRWINQTPAEAGLATAAQGALAASAVQPADLALVATSGAYGDLSGLPTLGTAADNDEGDFAAANHTHTTLDSDQVSFFPADQDSGLDVSNIANYKVWKTGAGWAASRTITFNNTPVTRGRITIYNNSGHDLNLLNGTNSPLSLATNPYVLPTDRWLEITVSSTTGKLVDSQRGALIDPLATTDAESLRTVALDESVATPTDGKILVFRSAGNDWVLEDKPAAGANPAMADISDTDLTGLTGGSTLIYNGTNWVDTPLVYLPVEIAAVLSGATAPAGDGVTDDTANIQSAVDYAEDNGFTLVFGPNKIYQITSTILIGNVNTITSWRGYGYVKGTSTGTSIRGNFNGPLVRTSGSGNWVTYNSATKLWEIDGGVAGAASSDGCRVHFEGIILQQQHSFGSCLQLYNAWSGSAIRNCRFDFVHAGLLVLQGFDMHIDSCDIVGNHFATHDLEDGHYPYAYGLLASGCTVSNCSIVGAGCGVFVEGAAMEINGRIEVNGIGVKLGTLAVGDTATYPLVGGGSLAPDVFGGVRPATNCKITCSLESNNTAIAVGSAIGVDINCYVHNGTNGPVFVGETRGRHGVYHANPDGSGLKFSGLNGFTDAQSWEVGAIVSDYFNRILAVDTAGGWLHQEQPDGNNLSSHSGRQYRITSATDIDLNLPTDMVPAWYSSIEQSSTGILTVLAGSFTISGPTSTVGQGSRLLLRRDADGVIRTRLENAPTVSQAEAEAGSSTALRQWTPERVGQAIAALAGAPTPTIVTSSTTPFSLTDARRMHLQVTIHSHADNVDFEVPTAASAGSAWLLFFNHSNCTVSVAGDPVGSKINGVEGAAAKGQLGGMAYVRVRSNAGGAPVVTVDGNIFRPIVSRGAAAVTDADNNQVIQVTGTQTIVAANLSDGFIATYIVDGVDVLLDSTNDHTIDGTTDGAGCATVVKAGSNLFAFTSDGPVQLA